MGYQVIRAVRRATAISTVVLAAAAAVAPQASAHGVISRAGDALVYTATNACAPFPCHATVALTVPETGIVELTDATSDRGLDWGPCRAVDLRIARCDSVGTARVEVVFDRNDDSLASALTTPVVVSGAGGDDGLTGGYADDRLDGGPGADTLVGGSGSDSLFGGAGDDSLDLRDGVADSADCGEGLDFASVDQTDPLGQITGCEVVTVAQVAPPPPPPDTPPDTRLGKRPSRETDRPTARFGFEATEPGARFRCSRDGGAYRPCRSPKRYRDLSRGRHVFKVRAVDGAGQADPTPAAYRWRVVR